MNIKALKLVGNRIIVKAIEQVLSSGIILPDVVEDYPDRVYKVVAVSDDYEEGLTVPKVGDEVIIMGNCCVKVPMLDKSYGMIGLNHIIAILPSGHSDKLGETYHDEIP